MATTPRSEDTDHGQSSQESMQDIQQAARETARRTTEQKTRMAGVAADASEKAVRAGADIMQTHAEAVQKTFQSGATTAAGLTERSAETFGRVMGLSGEEAQKAVQKSVGNLDAILQSGTVLAEVTQRLTGQWVDFARERLERNMDRLERLVHCRTPQEFAALQSEIVRDNLEEFLNYSRRAAEQSMRTAEEMSRRVGQSMEQTRRAA